MKHMIHFAMVIAMMTLSLMPAKADSPRMVVIEEGTNASCGPCASQNPTFQAYLENNKDMVIPLKIQAWFPGRDIMNAADSNMHNSRIRYYGIQNIGVPCATVNGSILDASSANYYNGAPADTMAMQQAVESVRGTMSPITLAIEETRNGNTMNIKVTVSSSQALSGANKLRVAIAERFRYYANAGSNGEKEFYNIMRKMLPNLNGETLDIAAGGSQSFEYSFNIPTTGQYALDPSMLYVVAFVQDDDSKEILQGASNAKEDGFASLTLDSFLNTIPRSGTITQVVNVNNPSNSDMTVSLSIDTEGFPLPTGWTATVTPTSVDVPAGGSVTVDVEVKAPATAAYVVVGVKGVPGYADKFNLASTTAFAVLSEKPKIVTFSGFSSFATPNYHASMTPALKADAVVFPYNAALLEAYASEMDDVEAMIFPIGGNPLKLPDDYRYANPLNTIEVALSLNRKVMIVAPQGMQWAYDVVQNIADGQMQEVQDFYNAIGLSYDRTKVRFAGNQLNSFSVRGVAGDVIGNRLNNGAVINCNQAASIQNQSYSLYTDAFTISNPAIAKPVLYYDNIQSDLATARIELDGNRMVYSTFGIESIGSASVANEFFKRCIDWLMTGTAASVEEIAEGSNEELSMAINPNPMSDMAVVNYTVNGQSEKFVTITVVDAMGRQVASLFSGMAQPGANTLSFNAAQLPAGAYRMITRTMGGSGVQLPLMINR
jgi:hypothetical protein